jgi:hypothetical protein
MPTNRTPIDRPRRPTTSDDVLEIFRRLENTPMRARKSDAFLDEDFRLHRLLGLYSERRCSICSVLDRSSVSPPWPSEYPAHKDWHRVRAVRVELLAAVAEESAKDVPNLGETPMKKDRVGLEFRRGREV